LKQRNLTDLFSRPGRWKQTSRSLCVEER
jgi:hypothetical protein